MSDVVFPVAAGPARGTFLALAEEAVEKGRARWAVRRFVVTSRWCRPLASVNPESAPSAASPRGRYAGTEMCMLPPISTLFVFDEDGKPSLRQ